MVIYLSLLIAILGLLVALLAPDKYRVPGLIAFAAGLVVFLFRCPELPQIRSG